MTVCRMIVVFISYTGTYPIYSQKKILDYMEMIVKVILGWRTSEWRLFIPFSITPFLFFQKVSRINTFSFLAKI
jgi:hypothetical protein